ncbi:hypothetical protein BJ165DRAFT_1410919 [Panaeolus papilionaceus]|nr:hypothetical protein BJ165DRAFT_1410919 [Panaeolus papilionaceus]
MAAHTPAKPSHLERMTENNLSFDYHLLSSTQSLHPLFPGLPEDRAGDTGGVVEVRGDAGGVVEVRGDAGDLEVEGSAGAGEKVHEGSEGWDEVRIVQSPALFWMRSGTRRGWTRKESGAGAGAGGAGYGIRDTGLEWGGESRGGGVVPTTSHLSMTTSTIEGGTLRGGGDAAGAVVAASVVEGV